MKLENIEVRSHSKVYLIIKLHLDFKFVFEPEILRLPNY